MRLCHRSAGVVAVAAIVLAAACARADSKRDLVKWRPVASGEAESKSSGKPVLYFFTADWCGPCHLMKAEVFSDPEMAKLIEKEYVPIEVLDKTRETGRNSAEIDKLFDLYEVHGFPTLVVSRPKSTNAVYIAGWAGKQQVTDFLKGVKAQLKEMEKGKKKP